MPLVQITETLKDIIKTERKKRKIRGDDLSKDIGKSPSYISQIERGNISTIDVGILYSIFKNIIDLPEKDLPDYLSKVIGNNIELSDEERKNEEWELNVEYQFRRFPISDEIIDYINDKLNQLDISSEELVKKINSNDELDDETLNKLEDNIVFVKVDKNRMVQTSIKFNLPSNFVNDIINRKKKTINKINMEGILFNLFLLEGKNNVDAHILTTQKIKDFKFFTLQERAKRIEEAKCKDDISLNDIVLPEDKTCNDLVNKILKKLLYLRDFNPKYGVSVLSNFNKNLDTDGSLIFALLKLEYYKLAKLPTDRKKEFLANINELIDDYSKEIKEEILL